MSDSTMQEQIKEQVTANPVVLYMKGTPLMPQCGFSAQVAYILQQYEVPLQSYNILENEELRQGIKDFSDWPTLPQLYVNGEFIGGCDIVTQLHESGELKKILEQVMSDG